VPSAEQKGATAANPLTLATVEIRNRADIFLSQTVKREKFLAGWMAQPGTRLSDAAQTEASPDVET
jgi:hypothetical protein